MLFSENVTFIIPIFRLKSDRIRNLKCIVPYILNTECKILIVEQAKDELSDLSNIIPVHKNIKHLLYTSNSEIFHKSGIINWAVKNHVDTKYIWVNDVDFYMKFDKVLSEDWNSDFIKPYISGKKLSADDTKKIIDGEKLNVSYEDQTAEYISLYGALSFIFEKNAFLSIGGMDETIFGWGKEDVELSARIKNLKIDVQEMDFKGIHLYHEISRCFSEELTDSVEDLAVACCHFNWCNYSTPRENLSAFINDMELKNIPLYGVELSLTDHFQTSGMERWIRIKVGIDNVCFQKEACINLLESKIPTKYTKIAWIDADLKFSNVNWYEETSRALNMYKLVQMFSSYIVTDCVGNVIRRISSLMNNGGPKKEMVNISDEKHLSGVPGGAWAARREMWKHGGLYPYSFVGGGDCAFIYSIFDMENEEPVKCKIGLTGVNENCFKFKSWKTKLATYINREVSYIKGDVVHSYHGDMEDRAYDSRCGIYELVNVDKNMDITSDGILKLDVNFDIRDRIYSYFINRKEDGPSSTKKVFKNKIVVYTCILGNYDELKEIKSVEQGISYVCFTDRSIKSSTWTIKPIPKFLCLLDNVKIARCIKILPHLFLEEYETSVWVDGSIEVLGNIHKFLDTYLKNYFAISKHPDRICIYDEGEAIVCLNKDTRENVDAQTAKYKSLNYPKNHGLIMSGIIARKHNHKKCIELANVWWAEVREHSRRDQMSFNYAAWKVLVYIDSINPRIFVSEYFQIWSHAHKGNTKVNLRKDYGDMKNYICGREV